MHRVLRYNHLLPPMFTLDFAAGDGFWWLMESIDDEEYETISATVCNGQFLVVSVIVQDTSHRQFDGRTWPESGVVIYNLRTGSYVTSQTSPLKSVVGDPSAASFYALQHDEENLDDCELVRFELEENMNPKKMASKHLPKFSRDIKFNHLHVDFKSNIIVLEKDRSIYMFDERDGTLIQCREITDLEQAEMDGTHPSAALLPGKGLYFWSEQDELPAMFLVPPKALGPAKRVVDEDEDEDETDSIYTASTDS